ncbi:MAG: hypothetical protein ACRDT6_18630 [Micromonosporaceae bacterium]
MHQDYPVPGGQLTVRVIASTESRSFSGTHLKHRVEVTGEITIRKRTYTLTQVYYRLNLEAGDRESPWARDFDAGSPGWRTDNGSPVSWRTVTHDHLNKITEVDVLTPFEQQHPHWRSESRRQAVIDQLTSLESRRERLMADLATVNREITETEHRLRSHH